MELIQTVTVIIQLMTYLKGSKMERSPVVWCPYRVSRNRL